MSVRRRGVCRGKKGDVQLLQTPPRSVRIHGEKGRVSEWTSMAFYGLCLYATDAWPRTCTHDKFSSEVEPTTKRCNFSSSTTSSTQGCMLACSWDAFPLTRKLIWPTCHGPCFQVRGIVEMRAEAWTVKESHTRSEVCPPWVLTRARGNFMGVVGTAE